MSINKEWHMENKMPAKATFEQRVKWHREHNNHCSCRPGFPEKLKKEMRERGIEG
ncbi:MAG: hypothetical protein ABH864_02325 [archaeon]